MGRQDYKYTPVEPIWQERVEEDAESLRKETCNRRLSRAARRLMERRLRPYLSLPPRDPTQHSIRYRTNIQTHTIDQEEDTVWRLLEEWLTEAQPSECRLFPSRDLWRHDEERSIPIRPPQRLTGTLPSQTLRERKRNKSKDAHRSMKHHRWWKCGYCDSLFLSRFYLDLHMHSHHSDSHLSLSEEYDSIVKENKLVCPADVWCHVLGEANCHEEALKEEPFYGRGSNGLGGNPDEDQRLKSIYQANLKAARAVSCDETSLRQQCHSILTDQCRVTDTSWFCDTLECPRHSFLGDGWAFGPYNHWKDLWAKESQYVTYSHSFLGVLVCLILLGWVYFMLILSIPSKEDDDDPAFSPPRRKLSTQPSRKTARTTSKYLPPPPKPPPHPRVPRATVQSVGRPTNSTPSYTRYAATDTSGMVRRSTNGGLR